MVMLNWLHDPLVHVTIQLSIALLFALSALHKLADRPRFAIALEGYALVFGRLLPPTLRQLLGWLLPALELAAAGALLVSLQQPLAALPAVSLLLLYTCVLQVSLKYGSAVADCGCHPGSRQQPPSQALVVRNLLLIALTCTLLWPASARALGWFDLLALVSTLATGVLLFALANQLISNHSLLRRP